MPKRSYTIQEDGKIYCPKCKDVFDISHFQVVPHKTQPDRYVCKVGNKNFNSGGRDRRKKTKAPYMSNEYQRFYRLLRDFNLTEEEYQQKLQEQNYCCAICNTHKEEFENPLSVDHDHSDGKVRGLLCIFCNSGLGQLKDSITILELAIKYLNRGDMTINGEHKPVIKHSLNSKDYFKDRMLYKRYKINLLKYNEILKEQDYKCAICGIPECNLTISMAVDHNHETGNIRGLVCNSCNKGIGLFKDNIELLQFAINYLKNYK